MALLDNYLNLIPSQHRDKPKFIGWLTANLKPLDDIFELAVLFDSYFDVDDAEGKQLDILGQIVGRSRVVKFEPTPTVESILEDDIYRKVVKAKAIQNLWKGKINDLVEMWETLFDEELIIRDNQDMTMTLILNELKQSLTYDLLRHGYLVPKPQSVGINIKVQHDYFQNLYHAHIIHTHKKNILYPYLILPKPKELLYLAHIRHSRKKATIYPIFTIPRPKKYLYIVQAKHVLKKITIYSSLTFPKPQEPLFFSNIKHIFKKMTIYPKEVII